MGMMDNFEPVAPSGYAEGVRDLVIENIETRFTSTGKETKNFTFVLYNDSEKRMYKTVWDDEFASRKITEIVKAVGLDPRELFNACKNGEGDTWMTSKLVGRHGEFDCRKGRPNKDGKQYLEPMTPSEIDYIEWKKKKDESNPAPRQSPNEPPIDSYSGFKDDMPDDGTIPF